jgi:hypothetical protein
MFIYSFQNRLTMAGANKNWNALKVLDEKIHPLDKKAL